MGRNVRHGGFSRRAVWTPLLILPLLSGCVLYAPMAIAQQEMFRLLSNAEDARNEEKFDDAASYLLRAKQLAPPERKDDIYDRLITVYFLQGKYNAALDAAEKYKGGDFPHTKYWAEAEICINQGKYNESRALLEKASTIISPDLKGKTLLYMADVHRFTHEISEEREIYKWILGNTYRNSTFAAEDRATAFLGLTSMALAENKPDEAESILNDAMNKGEFDFGGPLVNLIESANLLTARIHERTGRYADAERELLAALGRRRENRAETRTRQSNILSQLGECKIKMGGLEEAKRYLNEAKSLREATGSTMHPNHADILKGLADIAASESDFEGGVALARRALGVFDAALVPTHARIAPTAAALAALEPLRGHPAEAALARQRLDAILKDGPLTDWKQEMLESLEYYAKQLEKAGLKTEATHYRDLYTAQKDKP